MTIAADQSQPIPPRFITTEFTVCCDCGDDIWDGEPVYQVETGTRCLICQAQITPWVPITDGAR